MYLGVKEWSCFLKKKQRFFALRHKSRSWLDDDHFLPSEQKCASTIQCVTLWGRYYKRGAFTCQTTTTNFAYVTATNTFVRCDTSTRPLHMPLFRSAFEHPDTKRVEHVGKTCPVNYDIVCEYCRILTAMKSLRKCQPRVHKSPHRKAEVSLFTKFASEGS